MHAFEATGDELMKAEGVNALSVDDKAAANHFFDDLDRYGIFVVRSGELECWLSSLGAVGKKTAWTIDCLEKMGDDPSRPGYVTPTGDDVWEFMRGIADWVKSPARDGTTL